MRANQVRIPVLVNDLLYKPNAQIKLVKSKFMDSIQEYRRVEQDFTNKSKQRVGRQFKIGETYPLQIEFNSHIKMSSQTECDR